jgi:hypothetical protein
MVRVVDQPQLVAVMLSTVKADVFHDLDTAADRLATRNFICAVPSVSGTSTAAQPRDAYGLKCRTC